MSAEKGGIDKATLELVDEKGLTITGRIMLTTGLRAGTLEMEGEETGASRATSPHTRE